MACESVSARQKIPHSIYMSERSFSRERDPEKKFESDDSPCVESERAFAALWASSAEHRREPLRFGIAVSLPSNEEIEVPKT